MSTKSMHITAWPHMIEVGDPLVGLRGRTIYWMRTR